MMSWSRTREGITATVYQRVCSCLVLRPSLNEDSQAVFIEGSGADEALAWGREIAERFIDAL